MVVRLLHAGHPGDGALGLGLLPVNPIALALIAAGLLLIVAGLYRLHTYEEPAVTADGEPAVDEGPDA